MTAKGLVVYRGRTLIEWAIHSAIQAHIAPVLATDVADVKDVAKVGVTCLRPPQDILAAPSPTATVLWAAKKLGAAQSTVLYMIVPTTPLRAPADFEAARTMLVHGASVVGVHIIGHPTMLCTIRDGRLVPTDVAGDGLSDRGPTLYGVTGSMYAAYYDDLQRWGTYVGPQARPYVIPAKRALRIRDQEDYDLLKEVHARPRYGVCKSAT